MKKEELYKQLSQARSKRGFCTCDICMDREVERHLVKEQHPFKSILAQEEGKL